MSESSPPNKSQLWNLTSILDPQSIVASLTPTDGRLEDTSSTNLRAFSTYDDAEKNVNCRYEGRPNYGYGPASRRRHGFAPSTLILTERFMSFDRTAPSMIAVSLDSRGTFERHR